MIKIPKKKSKVVFYGSAGKIMSLASRCVCFSIIEVDRIEYYETNKNNLKNILAEEQKL